MENIKIMSDKKKFFITLCYIFILFALVSISSYYYNNTIDQKGKFFNSIKKQTYSIVNVGSSHTRSGIFYNGNKKALNLGVSAQAFFYDLKILEKFHWTFDEKSIVIIPISIFSFYSIPTPDNSKTYLNILPLNSLSCSSSEYYSNKFFSIFFNLRNVKELFINRKKLFEQYKWPGPNMSKETQIEDAQKAAAHQLDLSRKDMSDNPNRGIQDLVNLISFIESKKAKIIFITTPFPSAYNEAINATLWQNRIRDNLNITSRHFNKEFTYLDYSHDKRFSENYHLFYDGSHLNKEGAIKFTQILLKDIQHLN